jgi:hypothetical protein
VHFSSIGTVEGFVGEDDILFGEDHVGRLDFASDCRYVPIVERGFTAKIFFDIPAHARNPNLLTSSLMINVTSFPT